MGSDWNYYYDFGQERRLDSWKTVEEKETHCTLECSFSCGAGDYVILLPVHGPEKLFGSPPHPESAGLEINGSFHFLKDSQSAYVGPHGCRAGFPVHFSGVSNRIRLKVAASREKSAESPCLYLIPDLPPVEVTTEYEGILHVEKEVFREEKSACSAEGFTPGCGCGKSPGRFGFSKGDGVLDCAMPCLGVVDKMYLCGHPQYRKPFRWTYSTLPDGAALHGSFPPATQDIESDRIDVNHLSVRWETEFGGRHFACTYSLATPGIMTESDAGHQRLSSLEFAGNYRYVLIPGEGDSVKVLSLDRAAEQGIDMAENWLLLFGCTEFPDLPLLIVPDCPPERLEVRRNPGNGRLSELLLHGCRRMITATPFGIESPQPVSPENREFLTDAVRRCRFWSRAFQAYPVKCEDYFKLDGDGESVEIIQRFSYRRLHDAWNTEPLELAPLPPVLTLCGTAVPDERTRDFRFPTKFGYLRGTFGNSSRYTIPRMPTARRFPLREASGAPAGILKEGLREFFDFAACFPETVQPYPYAGSLMESYAPATTMMNFMDAESREKIRALAAARLRGACERTRTYDYPVIDWGEMMRRMPDDEEVLRIYRNPAMPRRRLWNWYERTEPFTGTRFHICYLNVGFLSSNVIREGTPAEIAALKIPLIENDWGVGLTFYYMYLCALASGDFSPVRENWDLIRSIHLFFERMLDWACMGTGYSDNAILWVEGANYGAFTAFANLAEAVGDREAEAFGIYLAAKQMALRMALLRSSQHYFHRFYGVEPWYITKFFHEESSPSYQFQNVPADLSGFRYRPQGIYNLTTEGLYPELFEAMRRFCPEDLRNTMSSFRKTAAEGEGISGWTGIQQVASFLICEALDDSVPEEQLSADIAAAESRDLLMRKWRGIHIFSRRLPENYFKAQLLAWNAMKHHDIWLEHWENAAIRSAEWEGNRARIVFEKLPGAAKIRFGCRKRPVRVLLNGGETEFRYGKDGRLQTAPGASGTLEILFA